MKFTIKNLKIEDQVQLEELSVEVTSQDIKENGLSILNIIKEVKPLIKEYMDTESKQEQKPLVDDEVEDVKPTTSGTLDELLKTLNK
jgi:hypothetical protein